MHTYMYVCLFFCFYLNSYFKNIPHHSRFIFWLFLCFFLVISQKIQRNIFSLYSLNFSLCLLTYMFIFIFNLFPRNFPKNENKKSLRSIHIMLILKRKNKRFLSCCCLSLKISRHKRFHLVVPLLQSLHVKISQEYQ